MGDPCAVMKRWLLFFSGLMVAVVILGIVFFPKEGRKRRANAILSKVLQSEDLGNAVERAGASEGVLFGDSSYAWRLNVSHMATNWVRGLKYSDEDDLAAAVNSIEDLLHTRLTPSSKRAVLRMRTGDWSVYVLTGDDNSRIHLLVYTF